MYALVAVARPLPDPLTYAIPAWLAGQIQVGHVVLVPLGKRGSETGYVVDLVETIDFDPAKCKPLTRLLDPVPAFNTEQLGFFRWVADYYLSPLGEVIHTALPSAFRARVVQVLVCTDAGAEALAARMVEGEEAQVLRECIARPGLTRRGLARRLDAELESEAVNRAVDRLLRKEWLQLQDKEIGETKARVRTVELVERDEARWEVRGTRMLALLERLAETETGGMDVAELLEEQGASARGSLNKLEERGLVRFGERERRDPLSEGEALGASTPPHLNPDQQAALAALTAGDATGTYLLFGVTGAGKTEVFLGAAQHALGQGKQVCVLVPEIGLTPQLVGRFRARFGDQVAVLHSGLTGTQRLEQWRRIRAGEAQVAVGARSALFAPFQRLGLLVVDEEHDDSYKQDDGVPYSARDLAVVLGARCEAPVVLATATPSLESWKNALDGRYTLLRLPKRATARAVPTVELVDLTAVEVDKGETRPLLAPVVVDALRSTFANEGKAIVLYNRRGYATTVQCVSCGAGFECPSCGISMTLHRKAWTVACHYCGYKVPYRDTCPVCHADGLEEAGKGTERIEEVLRELFPDVPMARMDADTTATRGAHHRILSEFRQGHTRMLVGTQIVAKGHDFPDVHTAVVVSADQGFRLPDFRAAERTFALLVQMAGRAGRGDVAGRVFVQTWKPDHYVLQHLDDVEGFLEREMRLRGTLVYPPFARLCLVKLDGVNRPAVRSTAEALTRTLVQHAREFPGVGVLGPTPAALPKLVGRWRFQIILRGTRVRSYRAFLRAVAPKLRRAAQKGVRVGWDIDPRHLM